MKKLLLLTSVFVLPISLAAEKLENVVVEGTYRFEPSSILEYLNWQKGMDITEADMDRALKILYSTELFQEVKISMNNGVAKILVAEKPIVHKVYFEGNKKLDDDVLIKEIMLNSRDTYSEAKVKEDVKRLQEIYKRSGRFGVKIEPKTIKKDNNLIDVVYEINEGDQSYIEDISFVGAKAFSQSELKDALISKEHAWYRFFSSTDTYDPDRLNYDKEALRHFYLNKGYVDFKVNSATAELVPGKGFEVSFFISEGKRFKFEKPDIQISLNEYHGGKNKLYDLIDIEKGEYFNADAVEKSVSNLTDYFTDKGFTFVEVEPVFMKDDLSQKIKIIFNIKKGEKIFIRNIDITGNTRTLDKVIRREMRIKEHDAFNASRIRDSKQRIDNLAYFEKVDIKTVPVAGEPGKVDLAVDVAEKSTGAFNVGVGWSSYDGMLVETGIKERNVLGTGNIAGFSVMLSQRETEYNVNLTNPYFLDRNLSAGIDLFHTTQDNSDYSSYESTTTGARVRFGWDYTDSLRQNISYTIKEDDVTDIDDDASLYIKQQEGKRTVSMVGQELILDKRDNFVNPTKGYYTSFGVDYAGVGGDVKFIRGNLTGIKYYALTDDVIFSARGDAGHIWGVAGQDVLINNRYFLGDYLLRGFDYAGIGARDKATDDALGGNWYATTTFELVFPVGLPKEVGLKGKVFFDAGVLGKPSGYDERTMDYDNSIRSAVGAGIVWQSPMGLINVDFALPVQKEDYDDTKVFRLNFGKGF